VVADAILIERAIDGDRQAAADLIERHAASVYAVCLGLLADPDQAQDAAQDTLLKGISRLATLKKRASFRSWLVAIAHNICRDSWKLARRRRELLDREARRASAVADGPERAVMPGMGQSAEPDEYHHLRASLARLPEKHRLPLLLYYFDGNSTRRVAEALDISPTGAATRLCRARRALRDILEVDHD
jgi:RNA polymerase sigma-70 factor (ECF subfamily)